MAFVREPVKTPNAIGDIGIELFNPDPTGTGVAGATYSVQVRYSDGSLSVLTGNLVPHLTQAQINSLLAFTAAMRTKAVAEILP